MINLQKVLSGQRIHVASSLLDLKKKEFQASLTCSCQGFCGITHLKHNFKKSKADEISDKVQRLSNGLQNHIRSDHENLGAFRKCYKCNLCDGEFSKQGHLKAHKKRKHTTREKKLVNIEYPFLPTNDEGYFKNKTNDVDNVEPGHSELEESIDDDSEENEVYSLSNSLGSSSKYSEGRDSSEGGDNSESGEV